MGNKLNIAIGASSASKTWKNKEVTWEWLTKKLATPVVTGETFKEYMSMTKADQDKVKDVGGYVGGYLHGGRRKRTSVVFRSVLSLDIDFAKAGFWEALCEVYPHAKVLHGTHKHSEKNPRLRLAMPLSREATPEEYEAVARKVAGNLGIELFDPTTFQPYRMMYWPSCPSDVEFYCESSQGAWLDVDKVLAEYLDWHDVSLWPTAKKEGEEMRSKVAKQEDPTTKRGIIGAFCRTYTVTEAMEEFASEVYSPTAMPDRYTFAAGSTSGGVVVYDDLFAYSHHATDPISGRLVNAYDLVRLALFGHLDEDGKTSASNGKMIDLCTKDRQVRRTIAEEGVASAAEDFGGIGAEQEDAGAEPADLNWMEGLDIDGKGKILSSAANISLILEKDPKLAGKFKTNEFDRKNYIHGAVPWRECRASETVRNLDFAGLRNYVEIAYGITGKDKIADALSLTLHRNQYHPVKEYLEGLQWDGTPRADTLLIDLFGAEDSHYVRQAMRKMLVGAVARIYRPGVKFELVLTLVSVVQGTGKSSFFRALGREWFSDSFNAVKGNASAEQLHGAWIMEIAELKGVRRSDAETVKHFLSKQEDTYRPAYGHTTETYQRQTVFVATTNETEFLSDPTGARRFMPVMVKPVRLAHNARLKAFIEDPDEIGQVWAEALAMYRAGEKLYLDGSAEELAGRAQRAHSEQDERRGMVEAYLDRKLPEGWDGFGLAERRSWLADSDADGSLSAAGIEERTVVCVAEVWAEVLGKDPNDLDRWKSRPLNELMRSLEGWMPVGSTKNFPIYGKQKYYIKTPIGL